MSSIMTLLGLPEWTANQDSPHIPVNEGVALGLILHVSVVAKGTTTPPGSPSEGDAYILGASPTGDWSTFAEHDIAYYHNGAWQNLTPIDRLVAFVEDGAGNTDVWRYDSGTGAWVEILSGGTDPNAVHDDTTTTLTVGYSHTPHSIGTVSSGTLTPDEADGAMQTYTNDGAHTLAPPSNSTSIHIVVTNGASAGAITTTGFSIVTGDPLTTTNADAFILNITKNGSTSQLHVTALQ